MFSLNELKALLKEKIPNIDLSPGSVVSDLILYPLSKISEYISKVVSNFMAVYDPELAAAEQLDIIGAEYGIPRITWRNTRLLARVYNNANTTKVLNGGTPFFTADNKLYILRDDLVIAPFGWLYGVLEAQIADEAYNLGPGEVLHTADRDIEAVVEEILQLGVSMESDEEYRERLTNYVNGSKVYGSLDQILYRIQQNIPEARAVIEHDGNNYFFVYTLPHSIEFVLDKIKMPQAIFYLSTKPLLELKGIYGVYQIDNGYVLEPLDETLYTLELESDPLRAGTDEEINKIVLDVDSIAYPEVWIYYTVPYEYADVKEILSEYNPIGFQLRAKRALPQDVIITATVATDLPIDFITYTLQNVLQSYFYVHPFVDINLEQLRNYLKENTEIEILQLEASQTKREKYHAWRLEKVQIIKV